MADVIRLMDSTGTRVLDSLASEYEDSFCLDTFGDLIGFHAEAEPKGKKSFIIARVQTWDPKQPDKAFYSYYNAYHLNKILFQTQIYLGKKLIHRLHVLNPLTNTDIIGSVQYFMIKNLIAESKTELKADVGPATPPIISSAVDDGPGSPTRPTALPTRKRVVSSPTRKVSLRIKTNTAASESTKSVNHSELDIAPSPAVKEAESGSAIWTMMAPAVKDISDHEDSGVNASAANFNLFVRRLSVSPRNMIPDNTFRVASTIEQTPAPTPATSPQGVVSLAVPRDPNAIDFRQRASSFDDRKRTSTATKSPATPVTKDPAAQSPMSLAPPSAESDCSHGGRRHTSFNINEIQAIMKPASSPIRLVTPTSPASKSPAPAGVITRFAVPVSPEEVAAITPRTAKSRRRSLSYANAVNANGGEGGFEDWAQMVKTERSPVGAEGEEENHGDYDTVRKFGGSAKRAGERIEEEEEDDGKECGDMEGKDNESEASKAEVKDAEMIRIKSIKRKTVEESGPIVTIDAVLFATDNDFLESSKVRAVFKQHALAPEDAALFEMKPFLGTETESPVVIIVEEPKSCELCYPSASSMSRLSPCMQTFHRVKCYLAALVLMFAMFFL
ncbi:hypothetical protein HK101_001586 [Irineochytrium annulatum]|nr:hypothetical protein HK101_001586 [Irineochytrium annulatum]